MEHFIKVFAAVFIAEMGDKTQLLLVAMAGTHKVRHILIGTVSAIALLCAGAVSVGALLGEYLPIPVIKSAAALAFCYFAYSALCDNGEDEEHRQNGMRNPILAVFITFFFGELGDKTQLTAITMAANGSGDGFAALAAIFAGCSLGLICADLIGLGVGCALKSRMPTSLLSKISFVIFALFGIITAHEAIGYITPSSVAAAIGCGALAAMLLGLCFIGIRKRGRKNVSVFKYE